jgi:very-short-patch-repair endonuclease
MWTDFLKYVILNQRPQIDETIFQSEPERQFYHAAVKLIPGLIPQVPVRGYQVDFGLPEGRVFFEVYGYQWHHSKPDMERDVARLRHLGLSGWIGWVFMADEVMADPEACARLARQLVNEIRRRK